MGRPLTFAPYQATPIPASPRAKEDRWSGKVSLLVADDDIEGEQAYLVVVATDGRSSPNGRVVGTEPMTELDELDSLAAEVFEGYLVRRTWPNSSVASTPCRPTSASSCSAATARRLIPTRSLMVSQIVEQSMKERTVRAGEEELFKHRAREKGRVKIIDLLRARLDAKCDAYKAELPSLQLSDIHISDRAGQRTRRMLTGGFYAEVTLEYIAALEGVRAGNRSA